MQVKLNRPIAYFKVLMAYPLFGPQNEAFIKKTGKKYATSSKYMLYSGPFKITGWKGTNDTWSFVKNNQYWDKQAVKLSKISYQVVKIPTPATSSTSRASWTSPHCPVNRLSS